MEIRLEKLWIREVGIGNEILIKDVYYIEGLMNNLLSISQSANKDSWIIFDFDECLIVRKKGYSDQEG